MTATLAGIFPFGRASTERPPRRPESRSAAFLLGAYPSALHVRWSQPRWLREAAPVSGRIAKLAVDVEPTVFWDGRDADAHVEAWKRLVDFREGDERGAWGRVKEAGNGTSGVAVVKEVLAPLGLDPRTVWFTDAVPWYLVKRRTRGDGSREQGDAIDEDYAPLAARDPRAPAAALPAWLDTAGIASWALAHRRAALRAELVESGAEVVLTLGEAARQVVAAIADRADGRPCQALTQNMSGYGEAGVIEIGGHTKRWCALIHPGQRLGGWNEQRRRWIERAR